MPAIDGIARLEGFGAGDGGVFDVVGDVQVDAAVLVLAVFGLQIGDELAQGLAFLGHHVGEKQRVEQAVALGQMALEADAAGLFAAHDDLALEHVVADKLEADAVLDEFAAVLLADAVEHFGGIEGAGDGAGPAFAAQHPGEQDGEDLVRVDEVAVLVGSADAVGVAVGAEAGMAMVLDGCFAEGADVGLDGFGIDAGKERIGCGADGHVGHADAARRCRKEWCGRAVHGVDAEFHAGLGDEVEVGEALDGLEVVGKEIDFSDGCGLCGADYGLAEIRFDGGDDGGLARAAVPGFVFHAVPLRGIVRGGDHDAAGGAALAHAEAQRRCGGDVVGELDGNAGGSDDLGAGAGEGLRAEAGVIADAEAACGIFVG